MTKIWVLCGLPINRINQGETRHWGQDRGRGSCSEAEANQWNTEASGMRPRHQNFLDWGKASASRTTSLVSRQTNMHADRQTRWSQIRNTLHPFGSEVKMSQKVTGKSLLVVECSILLSERAFIQICLTPQNGKSRPSNELAQAVIYGKYDKPESFEWSLLGQLRVDLITWVSNVRPPVSTSVRTSVFKKFIRFQWNVVCR